MDEIQKVLIKQGRKDLAQQYYEKVARDGQMPQEYEKIIADFKKGLVEIEKRKGLIDEKLLDIVRWFKQTANKIDKIQL